jgi:2-hydroxy-6-oxonona-2,4-dienedioate hydrolase
MIATTLTEESTSRYVQTPKWRIHYNEAGSGHPVIMLHGGGPGASAWSNFSQNITALAEMFRVIGMDMPGWGKSDPVTPTDRDGGLAIQLLMDELGIEKAAVVGNSMGGAATLSFAARNPDRVTHVVTMASAPVGGLNPSFFSAGGMTEGSKVLRETLADPSAENFSRLVKIMVYDSSFATPELMEERAASAKANPIHLENFRKPGGAHSPADTFERLAQVTAPALIIHGRDDRVVPLEISLRLATVLPNSTLVVFNHCGHWAQVEHANKFNWMLSDFIQREG